MAWGKDVHAYMYGCVCTCVCMREGGEQRGKAISLGPEYLGVSLHCSYNAALSFTFFILEGIHFHFLFCFLC